MSGWVQAFIIIAAVAIVVQMAILVAMFVQLKMSMQEFTRIANDLQGRVDPILLRVNRILEDSEGRISSVMGDTAEITRLAMACGGRRETLAGLSGMGDLVLTCTGSLSRNRTVGMGLGQGRKLDDILTGLEGRVAEGVRTTSAALGLARLHRVEMPIAEQMEAILMGGKAPESAIRELMLRPGRDE